MMQQKLGGCNGFRQICTWASYVLEHCLMQTRQCLLVRLHRQPGNPLCRWVAVILQWP